MTEWRQQRMKFSGCCSSCVNFSKLSWAQCRRFPPPHRVIASTDSLALTSSSWAPSKNSGHWRLVARTCERERHIAIQSRPFSGCLSASRWYLADFRFSLIEIETIFAYLVVLCFRWKKSKCFAFWFKISFGWKSLVDPPEKEKKPKETDNKRYRWCFCGLKYLRVGSTIANVPDYWQLQWQVTPNTSAESSVRINWIENTLVWGKDTIEWWPQ